MSLSDGTWQLIDEAEKHYERAAEMRKLGQGSAEPVDLAAAAALTSIAASLARLADVHAPYWKESVRG